MSVDWSALPYVREMAEVSSSGFLCLDPDGQVLYLNRHAREMFGRAVEGEGAIDLAELLIPADYEQAREALRRLRDGESPPRQRIHRRMTALRRDSSQIPVEVSATLGPAEAGCAYLVWVTDASEQAELLGELASALRGGSPGLAEVLDSLAEAVTIRDPHDHLIYANQAAIHHMGFDSLKEAQSRPLQAIFDDYLVLDERGRPLTMGDIPSVRLLGGEDARSLLLRTVNRETGEMKWNMMKSTLLRDDSGGPAATVSIIEDVTAEKTAQLRERFLAQATEALMSSLDFEETLRNVAWLAVPEIADWCAIDLVERGARQHVVVAHPDPQKLELAATLRSYGSNDLDPERGIGRVVATGIGELYPDITDEMLAQSAQDEEHLALLRSVGFRSAIAVPLRARGRTFGVMSLVTSESLRRYDEADLEFAEQLAGRAAIAVDNALLATERREIAETLQRSLLPDADPRIEGWEVATMYRAASASGQVEVGGDLYDFIETPDGWLALLGDVTGRGVQAAAMTSLVRHGARFLSKQVRSPAAILERLDEALREQGGLSLCSALCLRLEPGRVVMCSAGHPAPLILRDDGRIREIGAPGPLLGGWEGSAWTDRVLPVDADETLLMYTDGVTDTRGEHERFGSERLRRVLIGHAGHPPDELLAALAAELDAFQVAGQADDTGAVALRPTAVPSEPQPRVATVVTGGRSATLAGT